MKTKIYSLVIASTLFVIASCSKTDTATPNTSSPTPTPTPRVSTLSCVIDGQNYVPKTTTATSGSITGTGTSSNDSYPSVSVRDFDWPNNITVGNTIDVTNQWNTANVDITYKVSDSEIYSPGNSEKPSSTSNKIGSIVITQNDTKNKVYSGTYEVTYYAKVNGIIKPVKTITNGTFTIYY